MDAVKQSAFSRLPTELRMQIWHAALPPDTKPALFVYGGKQDRVREIRGEGFHWIPLLWHDYQISTPLHLVNHEARKVLLAWIGRQNSLLRECGMTFSRGFDPRQDAIYVPIVHLASFGSEFARTRRDHGSLPPNPIKLPFRCVATPAKSILVQQEWDNLSSAINHDYCTDIELLVVVDAPDDSVEFQGSQKQWEFTRLPFGVYTKPIDTTEWTYTPGSQFGAVQLHISLRMFLRHPGIRYFVEEWMHCEISFVSAQQRAQ